MNALWPRQVNYNHSDALFMTFCLEKLRALSLLKNPVVCNARRQTAAARQRLLDGAGV